MEQLLFRLVSAGHRRRLDLAQSPRFNRGRNVRSLDEPGRQNWECIFL